MRCMIRRAMACAAVMSLSAPAWGQAPPDDGVVKVRKAGDDVAAASLGFVADGRGNVVVHLGAGGEEVAGEAFLVRARNGEREVDRPAEGIAYDEATGLALLRVDGDLPAPYRLAGAAAEPGRLVYGAASAGEDAGFAVRRGVVQGVDAASESDSPRPDWIGVSASIVSGGQAAGSPLFDNCGNLLGVILGERELAGGAVPAAVPAAWLERVFGDAGWTPDRAERECPPESERLDAIVQARVQAAQAGSREGYVAWAMGGVSVLLAVMLVFSQRSLAGMKRGKALAELDLEEARAAAAARGTRPITGVPDVLLRGSDQSGERIELRIPGGSIARPSGAVVGRVPLDGVFVVDHPEVSRRHLRFLADGGVLKVEDLGSTNGTHLGDTPLEAGAGVAVADDARLSVGSLRLAVRLEPGGGAPDGGGAGEEAGEKG